MTRGGYREGSGKHKEKPEHLILKPVSTRLLPKTITQLEQEEEGKGPFIRKLVEQHYKEVDEN